MFLNIEIILINCYIVLNVLLASICVCFSLSYAVYAFCGKLYAGMRGFFLYSTSGWYSHSSSYICLPVHSRVNFLSMARALVGNFKRFYLYAWISTDALRVFFCFFFSLQVFGHWRNDKTQACFLIILNLGRISTYSEINLP